jgi:hypothetical protein
MAHVVAPESGASILASMRTQSGGKIVLYEMWVSFLAAFELCNGSHRNNHVDSSGTRPGLSTAKVKKA